MSDAATDLLPADATAAAVTPPVDAAKPADAAAVVVDANKPAEVAKPEGLQAPGADAKPEEWADFFNKLGAPKTGEDYKLALPEGGDSEFANEAAGVFAKAGLLPRQAEQLVSWWNEKAGALTKAQTESQAAADAKWVADRAATNKIEKDALTNEWGGIEKSEANMNIARQAVLQFLPQDKAKQNAALSALEDSLGYGETMRFFHRLGQGLGEGQLRGATTTATAVRDNSPEARAARMYPTSVNK